MLCFAYGSNMDLAQMRERCPSTRFAFIAKLPDHRLVFPRKSKCRCCGVASVKPVRMRRMRCLAQHGVPIKQTQAPRAGPNGETA
jgi:hypothetical protein